MISFSLKRLLSGIALMFVVATVTFFLMSIGSDTIARNLLGQNATEAQVLAKEQELGLDQPVFTRYLDWLGGVAQGDLGTSWFSSQQVTDMLASRFPVTFSVVIVAVLCTAVISAVLGIVAAVNRGWIDKSLTVGAMFGHALPNFFVAVLLVWIFAVTLQWLPATGFTPISEDPTQWARGITLPVIALLFGTIPGTAQQVRGAVIDVLRQDYVRTLRSRGLSSRSVLFKHVLRNAAPPALTVLALQVVGLLGGAVIIERIFALPGIGRLAVDSTQQQDIPVILGFVLVMVALVVVVNLLIDLATGWLNPKARLA
ncbi:MULTISPECIES: ABC transporter permease [Microbacterium]|uniref:ABC transporter permease n=1 Tax=Microbacterium marmarense TaxID=3122051 RepID=A0ABU8LS63_9MICO